MRFNRMVLAVVFLLAGVSGLHADAAKRRELFNGRNLSGWETWLSEPFAASQVPDVPRDEKGNYTKPLGLNNDPLGVFKVEVIDGQPVIHVSGEGFGTLTTTENFSNYRLRLQFKWGERRFTPANRPRNAGVLYHAYGKHGEVGGRWMNTHQFQVEEGGCGDYVGVGLVAADAHARPTDAKKRVYDPAGETLAFHGSVRDSAKCTRGAGEERPFGEWNTFEIYCVGDDVVQVLNGQVTARMTKSRKENGEALTSGHIAIQLEGAEMFFRDITIEALAAMPEKF